jgi:hypothetical protein
VPDVDFRRLGGRCGVVKELTEARLSSSYFVSFLVSVCSALLSLTFGIECLFLAYLRDESYRVRAFLPSVGVCSYPDLDGRNRSQVS